MKCLGVKRFKQYGYGGFCAVASVAAVTNYFNKDIDYEDVKSVVKKHFGIRKNSYFDGLARGQIGYLLNLMGFNKVEMYVADLDFIDWSTRKNSKKATVERIKRDAKKKTGAWKEECKYMYDFLIYKPKNLVCLDYNFGDRIREAIDNKLPILTSFNWNLYFKMPNYNNEWDLHCVVIDGYDKKYVRIIDSHYEYYKYSLSKFRTGKYKVSWENLMVIASQGGEVIVPSDYRGFDNELV